MKGYKRILTLILFALVSLSGAFFGCRGRYDGVKITADKSDTGLQLYLGDEVGDSDMSVGSISFTITGASEGAVNNLKYSFEGNEESKIVKITNTQIQANTATLTLQAISGGSTTLVAMSEEGGKTCSVKIECIKQVKAMSFNSAYYPAMYNVAGSQLTINTKKIDFVPADTTQNQVTYSLKNAIDGISITPAGIITLEKQILANDFVVVATNKADSSLSSEISVHLVKPLKTEDSDGITIYCDSNLYEDDKISLTTVGEESSVIIRADVDTTERITLGYKIDRNSGSINCVNVEQSGYEFGVYANNIGTCKLIIQVYFDDYPDLEIAEKEIEVSVVELPTTITVNGINQDFAADIYTYYQNGLGQEYTIKIGDYFAYDKSYVLASSDPDSFEIRKSDGTEIKFGTIDDDGVIGGEFDVLQSNSSIYVKGLSPNADANLYIYANGTIGKRIQLVRKLTLKTLLGSENLEPNYRTLDGEDTNIFYVELGKSFELRYKIDQNTSAKNIKLLNADGSEVDDYISIDITSSTLPTITVTGIKSGSLSCKLMLENLVESETFIINVFVPVNYLNAEKDGGVYFKVDSPLSNRNIAEAVYTQYGNYSSVNKMVVSLGATVQLYSSFDPTDATIINTKYSSVLLHDGEVVEDGDASEYVAVYSNGYLIAKRILPEVVIIDGEEVHQSVAIKIENTSLITNDSGDPETITSIKYIFVEGYVPLKDVAISKKTTSIYWNSYELLNPVQRDIGSYKDTVSLSLYPNSIAGSKVNIEWDYPQELTVSISDNGTSATIMALTETKEVRDLSVYTVTATIRYYTTTIVRRCTVNVLKATKAKTLIAYVDDNISQNNTVAYFEFEGANQITPSNQHITAEVYSENNVKDVTFDTIYYKSLDTSVAVVDENGYITPVGAGRTYIHVYAEDMMTSIDDYVEYKVIEVVVADGSSKEAAFKISTESDFDKLASGPEYFYYLANDITFTHSHFIPEFNGNFDGNNHYINGIILNAIQGVTDNQYKYISLFGTIGNQATIENLNLTFSLNYNVTENVYLAGLAINNNGRLDNVDVNYLNANIIIQAEKEVYFAGVVINNYGKLVSVSGSANINVDTIEDQDYTLGKLYLAGIALNNHNCIYGQNDNYKPVSANAIQEFDFAGKIVVSNKIFVADSAIGGIVACNNQTLGSTSLENGLAVDITIQAVNINNVGGIAGINLGTIQNALANVDIVAHDNVGGAVGKQGKGQNSVGSGLVETTETTEVSTAESISNVVVEMYDNIDGINFGKVQGNENVGGLVGSMYGYFTINKASITHVEYDVNDNPVEIIDGYYNDLVVSYSYMSRSYVYAYSNQSGIFGQDKVGGLIGNSRLTEINKCYANTKLSAGADKNVGGLVGYAQNTRISKAYSIVSCQNQDDVIFGSAIGQVETYSYISPFYAEKSYINEFYSTNQGEFVGEGTEFEIGTRNAYKENLQDINTFEGWNIGTEISYSSSYDWLISANENNGCPVLMYNISNLMRKVQPTQISIDSLEYEDSIVISEDLIVLNIEKVHKLSDVIRVYTDVSSRATIYAYADKQGVLNTRNTTNKLSSNTSIQSNTEQIVTLTFVLGNNISVTKSIQIAFVKLAKEYSVSDLKIKKGHTQNIFAKASFDANQLPMALNSQSYKLGILKSDLTNIKDNQLYIEISNSLLQTIDEKEYLLFSSGSAVLANQKVNKSAVSVTLFYELDYSDLNGDPQKQYVKVLDNQSINLNVYSGASSIYASTTNIDMTIIDEVSFTITVKTDDVDSKIYFDPASENIYCKQSVLSDFVEVANNATIGTESSAKVELYILSENDKILQDNTLQITFGLRFLDKYFENERFNKEFTSTMRFWAERESETDVVLTQINLKAMPQWLLKIDINNYPAGKSEQGTYVPVSVPANTLTPGQVGLMVIDIYPEYAYYDQIEIVSSEDADGNHISFIQVAENSGSGQGYVELKPNTNIIEKGLVLMPYTTILFNEDKTSYRTTFDGRFYVKTLMGTNVKNQEEITITVTGLTYQIDEDGNFVLDQDGNYVVSRQLIKTLVVVVNPAPEVALAVNDEIYTSPVYVKEQDGYMFAGNYNLVIVGDELDMQIELKNGLVATRSEVVCTVYKEIRIVDGEAQNGEILDNIRIYQTSITGEDLVYKFKIGFTDEKLTTGNIVEILVRTYKTINGFTESYTSNKQKFLIVDKIMTGFNINNSYDSLNFTVNQPKNLHAQIEYTTKTSENNGDIDNLDLNDNGAYWSGYDSRNNEYHAWGKLTEDEKNIINEIKEADKNDQKYDYSTPIKSFENYIAYKTVDQYERAKDGNGNYIQDDEGNYEYNKKEEGSFGITATNNSIGVSKFKVEFYSYYIQETIDNITSCKLHISPDVKEDKGISKDYATPWAREFDMNITVATTLDEPLTVYTIEDFYSMAPGNDYILMNDLYFGNVPEEVITQNKSTTENEVIEGQTWARTYTPFVFDSNSFDGNMHTIHFYGNYFNTTYDSNGKEISSYVNERDESVANIGLFTSINANSIVKDVDIIYHSMPNEDENIKYAINIDQDTTMPANTINFGGLTVTNNGIVSNVFVYYEGDVNVDTKSVEGQVNIAGFVYQNSGKITYSSVYGPNWNDNNFAQEVISYHNIKFKSTRAGNIATFACTNSYLISNCETECIGIENIAPASRNAKIAGFVVSNSGRIFNSSSSGQVLEKCPDEEAKLKKYNNNIIISSEEEYQYATAIGINDQRIVAGERNKYFATLSSNGNIAGFVYINSGEIENAYSTYPMLTGARTAGFVFDNSNAGSVTTSYTACYYDGSNTNNSAYAPFVGTNELGEVLNDPQTSVVKYSYYILDEHEVYEEDITFKEPATRISLSGDDGSVSNHNSFVGFDKGKATSIWNVTTSKFMLPTLTSNEENKSVTMRNGFKRMYIQEQKDGYTIIRFTRVSNEANPYQIADAYQFVKVFNDEATWNTGTKVSGYLNHSIRLINDIDLSDYAGTELLNNIRKVVYMGDFDGNGMIISGINLVGSEEFAEEETENPNPINVNIYSNVSSSYGLFNQIGTATVTKNNQLFKYSFSTNKDDDNTKVNETRIRNLTLKVDNVSKSTSAYTGILAGVIINTDVQSVKIQSNNVSVLGKNVVGGLAGAVFGDSKIYNVSVNANVTSSYQSTANNLYKNLEEETDGNFGIEYKAIDFSTEKITELPNHQSYNDYRDNYKNSVISINNYGFGFEEDGKPTKIDLAGKVSTCSYAGGVVGIADVYDDGILDFDSITYNNDFSNDSSKIINRVPNMELLTVYGDITISAEIVGGIVGGMSEDTYLGNVTFEVANSDSQRFAGLFVSGGIAGINNGGIIQFSKVELEQAYADSNDNRLTNQTGNNLFNGLNVYPYAVGGLVGIERGGYLLTDYSKANVISPNAKYVGGLVGYLTRHSSVFTNGKVVINDATYKLSDLKLGRYVLMEEVYTTGNVFAGDEYVWVQIDDNKYECTPTSYAGGIVGYYKIEGYNKTSPIGTTSSELQPNRDIFNSVIGINAFHIPANYTFSSEYVFYDQATERERTAKYSDLMNGYYGKRELSNGKYQYAQFLPRLGSIFGCVEDYNDNFKYQSLNPSSNNYYNLYTNFVYNTNNLTDSVCKNANSGSILNYVGADNCNGEINDKIFNDMSIDTYRYLTGSSTTQSVEVNFNTRRTIEDNSIENIPENQAYLVLRALSTYRKYQANENGIYAGWDNNWIFNSPVYPKFKPKDWNDFISIESEEQLRSIRSGNKYRLVKDIYLTSNWEPKNLNHITLISAKRDDGLGIYPNSDSQIPSLYYAIYNINISGSTSTNSYGFFGELRYSTVKNINFVYGTNLTNPDDGATYHGINEYGFNYTGVANNVGLLAGSINRSTSIESCNLYVNTAQLDDVNVKPYYTIQLSHDGISNTKNVGGMVGSVKSGSYTSGRISFGSLSVTETGLDRVTRFYETDIEQDYAQPNFTVQYDNNNESIIDTFNLGGFIGWLDSADISNESVSSLNLAFSIEAPIREANVGGTLGKFTISSISKGYKIESSTNASIKVSEDGNGRSHSLYVGGAFGNIDAGIEAESIEADIPSITVNAYHLLNDDDPDTQGLYVGGVAGYLNASSIDTGDVKVGKITVTESKLANNYVGGLVGYLNGQSTIGTPYKTGSKKGYLSTSLDGTTSIEYNNKIDGKVNIGGAFGYVSNQATIDNVTAYFSKISLPNSAYSDSLLNVGGFIGAVTYEDSGKSKSGNTTTFINNCYAKGEIEYKPGYQTTPSSMTCAGFVANGAVTDSNKDQLNTLSILNSMSDVEINLGRVFQNSKVAGFVASGIDTFKNCISYGDINISDIVSGSGVVVAGFASYSLDSKLDKNSPNYSLTTIKAIASDYTKIVATSTDYNNKILYNYNLSGVFSEQGKIVNTSTTPDNKKTGERTYSALANDVRDVIESYKNYIIQNIFEDEYFISLDDMRLGTKVQPKNMSDSLISGSYGNFKNNEYFVITGNYPIQTYSINANLIGDNKDEAYTLTFSVWNNKTTEICADNMLSGVAITSTRNVIIQKNNGYIFNCVSVGKLTHTGSDPKIVGFVDENKGKINACGSNAYLDAEYNDSIDVVGFVYVNTGIIANSYATNVFLNTVAKTTLEEETLDEHDNKATRKNNYTIGFVWQHQVYNGIKVERGIIANCYSSPSIFDLIDKDGNILSRETDLQCGNAANTFPFGNSGFGDPYYCINYQDFCNVYSEKSDTPTNYADYQAGAELVLYRDNVEEGATINETINYGLPTSLSYNVVVNENFALGSLNTGDGTSATKPFKINNELRFKYLGDTAKQPYKDFKNSCSIINIRLVNNIDMYKVNNDIFPIDIQFCAYRGVNVNNLQLFTLYNVHNNDLFKFDNGTNKNDKPSLQLTKLGVIAYCLNNLDLVEIDNVFVRRLRKSTGLLTNAVYSLKADSCYVSLQEPLEVGNDSTAENELYYGLFAGKISDNVNLNGCFANADININSCKSSTSQPLNVYIGTLLGKCIDNDTTDLTLIRNSFATGTINVYNQPDQKTSLYVGGLFGTIKDSVKIRMCYSNVSIKNRIKNKYYNNAYIGAFGGEVTTQWSEYGFTYYSNTYDQNISLTDKIFGNQDSTKNLSSNLTLRDSSIFYGNDYENTVTENHLPIQKTFKGDKIVYKTLNISDSEQTGSKMAPKKLTRTLGDNTENYIDYYDVWYYMTSSIDILTYDAYCKNITIIGNDKTIYQSRDDNYTCLFSYNYINNVTISGVVITNRALACEIDNSYIYNLTLKGETGKQFKVADISSNGSHAPISSSKNSFYHNCSVNILDLVPSAQSNKNLSAFIGKSVGDTIKDVNITVAIGYYNEIYFENVSGLVSSLNGTYSTNILGTVNIDITAKLNPYNPSGNYCKFGGVIALLNGSQSLKMYANANITLDIINGTEYTNYYIGGIIGELTHNSTKNCEFNLNIKKASITNSSNYADGTGAYIDSWTSISPVIGFCNTNLQITGITIDCVTTFNIDRSNMARNGEEVYIGGIAGTLSKGTLWGLEVNKKLKVNLNKELHDAHANMGYIISRIGGIVGQTTASDANIWDCFVAGDINVTDYNQIAFCVVGGVVGYLGGGYLADSPSDGLVAGLSYATNSYNKLNLYDARVFEDRVYTWVEHVEGGSHGAYSWDSQDFTHSEQYFSNYGKHAAVPVPLAVGGIIGYYVDGTLESINKTTGDVRALVYDEDANDLDDDNINMVIAAEYVGANDNATTDNQKVNSEKCQARVGGICGLAFENKAYLKQVGSEKHIYSNFGGSGMNDQHGRTIRIVDINKKWYGKFLKYGVDDHPEYGAYAGYYKLSNVNASEGYFDFGNQQNLVTGANTNNISFNNFNYVKWNVNYNYEKISKTDLSKSDYTKAASSIFTTSYKDIYLKYDGVAYNTKLDTSDNYLCYIGYVGNNSGNDLNGMKLVGDEIMNANYWQTNYSLSGVKVFAGYQFGSTTYNRSYWYVASDKCTVNGQAIEDERINLYFYLTQHWAGPVVGGVIYNTDESVIRIVT